MTKRLNLGVRYHPDWVKPFDLVCRSMSANESCMYVIIEMFLYHCYLYLMIVLFTTCISDGSWKQFGGDSSICLVYDIIVLRTCIHSIS